MSGGTPKAEVDIDEAMLRALLADQHPDLVSLPIAPFESGWDNVMFRLGEALTVRLPRRAESAGLIAHEQAWLPLLAPALPLPAPAPVRVGGPGRGYPWTWSILPWLEGGPADLAPPAPDQAAVLAGFLKALHQPAPPEAPANPARDIPLSARAEIVEGRLSRLTDRTSLAGPEIGRIWRRALAAAANGRRLWLHGDLHARNVLTRDGAFSGVIDWGDICAGDPATDLAAVWALFEDAGARGRALAAYGADEALVTRAKGWAVSFGAVLLETGLVDNPRHAAMGAATLRRVAADG